MQVPTHVFAIRSSRVPAHYIDIFVQCMSVVVKTAIDAVKAAATQLATKLSLLCLSANVVECSRPLQITTAPVRRLGRKFLPHRRRRLSGLGAPTPPIVSYRPARRRDCTKQFIVAVCASETQYLLSDCFNCLLVWCWPENVTYL